MALNRNLAKQKILRFSENLFKLGLITLHIHISCIFQRFLNFSFFNCTVQLADCLKQFPKCCGLFQHKLNRILKNFEICIQFESAKKKCFNFKCQNWQKLPFPNSKALLVLILAIGVVATSKNNNINNLRVATDSSGGTSPYVYTPSSELSPDVHETRALPTLAPLEFPNFNISNIVKKNMHPLDPNN